MKVLNQMRKKWHFLCDKEQHKTLFMGRHLSKEFISMLPLPLHSLCFPSPFQSKAQLKAFSFSSLYFYLRVQVHFVFFFIWLGMLKQSSFPQCDCGRELRGITPAIHRSPFISSSSPRTYLSFCRAHGDVRVIGLCSAQTNMSCFVGLTKRCQPYCNASEALAASFYTNC